MQAVLAILPDVIPLYLAGQFFNPCKDNPGIVPDENPYHDPVDPAVTSFHFSGYLVRPKGGHTTPYTQATTDFRSTPSNER